MIANVNVEDGMTLSEPSAPVRTGFDFCGWFTDSTGNYAYDFARPVVTDFTLHAKWEVKQYRLKIYDYDGSLIVDEYYDYGFDLASEGIIFEPVNEGYSFFGWDVTPPEIMPAEDVTLHATSDINSYTLSILDYNNDILFSGTYTYGDDLGDISYPVPSEKEGYTFSGWDKDIPETMPGYNISIQPLYSKNTYVASFLDYQGNTISLSAYEYGSSLAELTYPDVPETQDYTFLEWDQEIPETMPGNDLVFRPVYNYERQLIGLGSDMNDFYGRRIIVSGDYIVVSATGFDSDQGAIYVYKFSDPTYERIIVESRVNPGSLFGSGLIVTGDYIIASAYGYNHYQGKMFVYKLSDESYSREIVGEGTAVDSYFGIKFSVTDNYLVVSAHGYDSFRGAIYVYKLNDSLYERRILASNGSAGDRFSHSYMISGNYLYVVSPTYNSAQGAVYVYKFNNEVFERRIVGTGTVNNDVFGSQIIISGDYILIPCVNHNMYQGVLYIYKTSDEGYERMITGANTGDFSFFSEKTLISDDYIIVSASGYDNYRGTVYIYKFSDITYERQILAPDGSQGDHFSGRIAVRDDYIISSSPNYDGYRGKIYIYKTTDEAYERMLTKENPMAFDQFGESFSFHDNYLVVQHYFYNGSEGMLAIYDLTNENYQRNIYSPTDPEEKNSFGQLISYNGDNLIVGLWSANENRGAMCIYDFTDDTYFRMITASDGEPGEDFGYNFAKTEDYLVICSYNYNNYQGKIYIVNI